MKAFRKKRKGNRYSDEYRINRSGYCQIEEEQECNARRVAKAVGVSAQAVSKWENGGVPDTELLPKIADYFSISIDALFGRNITDYSNLQNALARKIVETEGPRRFEEAFEWCWIIERALFGKIIEDRSVKDQGASLDENEQIYSCILTDEGFTRMGVANRLPYFLIVPETKNKDAAFFKGINYTELFKDLSDQAFFDTLVFLNKRQHGKAFTPNLLIQSLHMDSDKALSVIGTLRKYGMIHMTQIEMDDATQEVYTFVPTPSFTAVLIFARELIDRPNRFAYGMNIRTKPYFE